MIDPTEALDAFERQGVRFFAGVPDSLLKEFNACLSDRLPKDRLITAHNEGAAVALVAGHFLATGELGVVYMQNSGLGNAINPLVSLTSPEVYGVPILLVVGWRGRPGFHDEPQHAHQGRTTIDLLSTLGIEVIHLNGEAADWKARIERACALARDTRNAVALVVAAGAFSQYEGDSPISTVPDERPLRSDVIGAVLDRLPESAVVVATTGYTSREMAALREARSESQNRDLLVVGSMGHASMVALALSLARPDLHVVCLDGDGSMAMHMGALALIGRSGPTNLTHVLLNNGVHESVGGQPTALDFAKPSDLAIACGYKHSTTIELLGEVGDAFLRAVNGEGPSFIDVRTRSGTLANLPRPDSFRARGDALRDSLSK